MKAGTLAALAAGLSLKPSVMVIAQEISGGSMTQADPLSFYTQSTFLQYVNSVFRLHGFTIVDVTLEKVEDTLPATTSRAGGRESFILHFRGGNRELPQNTYTVEHPALGTFMLFLVPSGPDENGAQGYTATLNRLAYSAKPAGVPRKSPSTKSTGGQKSEPSPAGPPTESPDPPSQAPKRTLQPKAPARTLRPKAPAKRSRKKDSSERFREIGFGIDN